jgi:hypothetical protein
MDVGGITPENVAEVVGFLKDRIANYQQVIDEATAAGHADLVFGYTMRRDGFEIALDSVRLAITRE